MLADHLRRGAVAGAVGGVAYGLFVAAVGNPLVAVAETFEHGHADAGETAATLLSTAGTSVLAGVLWGMVLGIAAFGVAYYLFEPVLPGGRWTRSALLGAAGFVTVSGAPWLVLPPQPPGVEQALPTGTRLVLYAGLAVAGALACAGALLAFRRLDARGTGVALLGAALPFAALFELAWLAPANPASGPAPEPLVTAFRAVTVIGQFGLWAAMAAVHARFGQPRSRATVESLAAEA